MKEVKFYLPKEAIKQIEESGIDIDLMIEKEIQKMIIEFKNNPEKFIEDFKNFENKYEFENHIN